MAPTAPVFVATSACSARCWQPGERCLSTSHSFTNPHPIFSLSFATLSQINRSARARLGKAEDGCRAMSRRLRSHQQHFQMFSVPPKTPHSLPGDFGGPGDTAEPCHSSAPINQINQGSSCWAPASPGAGAVPVRASGTREVRTCLPASQKEAGDQ